MHWLVQCFRKIKFSWNQVSVNREEKNVFHLQVFFLFVLFCFVLFFCFCLGTSVLPTEAVNTLYMYSFFPSILTMLNSITGTRTVSDHTVFKSIALDRKKWEVIFKISVYITSLLWEIFWFVKQNGWFSLLYFLRHFVFRL